MSQVDRKFFVPIAKNAYKDVAQVIGYGATISAPHMHSYCLSLLADHTKPGASVLDIGSGSGYLTAVFGLMVGETGRTVGVERIPELVKRSIDAIKQTPAGHLMDKGRIVVHGKQHTIQCSHPNICISPHIAVIFFNYNSQLEPDSGSHD
ncbi:hypothetical protein KC19_5G202600 [Ceratodon purpureus]|uniref:protein-L-isoaspartate(D-aspartate) O-methyltransferase n=1 Tax=Ceratodon purpureus TaxID=3225 RepID=A0A8T0I4R7_CERPU|nr:hypothetical protein KC19_5G202600 [Ceratodon purpureus]